MARHPVDDPGGEHDAGTGGGGHRQRDGQGHDLGPAAAAHRAGDIDHSGTRVRLELGRGHHSLQAHVRHDIDDREQGDCVDGRLARVDAAMLDLFVNVQGAVPQAVGIHRDKQARHEAAFAADPGQAEPALSNREGAGVVGEHEPEPGYREADDDDVLDCRHPDLGAGGDLDADDRDDEHDEAQGGVDGDEGPDVTGVRAEDGQDRRAEDDDFGDCADDVAHHHEPPGYEAKVRIDGPPDPLEGRAGVGDPEIQPAVAVGDDEHRDHAQQEDRPGSVGSGHSECR